MTGNQSLNDNIIMLTIGMHIDHLVTFLDIMEANGITVHLPDDIKQMVDFLRDDETDGKQIN